MRDGEKFIARTDGPDGALNDYPIAYTFGVYPLQQYLIAVPSGRYQALGIAWDSPPKEQGGQRWFHLYPDQQLKSRSEPIRQVRHIYKRECSDWLTGPISKQEKKRRLPALRITQDRLSWMEIDIRTRFVRKLSDCSAGRSAVKNLESGAEAS